MKEFEDIIALVTGGGTFQKRLLYCIFGPVFLMLPLSWMNEIFLLQVPPHWCSHPSQAHLTGSDLDEWKKCFLPEQIQPDGAMGFDSCAILIPKGMSNETFWTMDQWNKQLCPGNSTLEDSTTISCSRGWKYDRADFSETAPSQNDWVCDKAEHVPNLFTIGTMGGIFGMFLLGYCSDRFGRKSIFLLTTILVVISGVIKTFVSHNFVVYAALKTVSAACYVAVFHLPFTIITEISPPEYRTWAIGISCITWTAGSCLLPLVSWLLRDWMLIALVTTIPLGFLVLGWNFVPESPRWALTKNKVEKAKFTLRAMATVNKTEVPSNMTEKLTLVAEKMQAEKSYGYISLFSKPNMAKKTFFLACANVGSNFLYYSLMLNVSNMAGNTFLNFFLLSVIEGPAILLCMWMLENVGRRWSHAFILFLNFLCLGVNSFIAATPSLNTIVIAFCLIAKFNCTISFTIIYVQTIEIFPTCVRNTGMGFTTLFASIVSIFGPHVIHLGTIDARVPYIIMALISFVGAFAATMLPETKGADLPETLAEAEAFGQGFAYLSWRAKPQANLEPLKLEE
ncbi:hypothetical protein TCAL_01051 [Tigriopus californicus]|uniref:Major facilitator superfamily (MFS) profile domain-containing protein n=1 Tax=Tigriopus californicus TaxID=6832 RepID=A0A553P2E4_TIGCA|nr:solute carrier family 22 member 7-like [Tigriopus californicus]TRY71792.1 hypothetical protein TCAL_01051 [Tigriopus californicus]